MAGYFPVCFLMETMNGRIDSELFAGLKREFEARVLRSDKAVIMQCLNSVDQGLVTAAVMKAAVEAIDCDPGLYNSECLLGAEYKFILYQHPRSVYDTKGDLLHIQVDNVASAVNDMLMGPKGSGTLYHVDAPTPVCSRFVVLQGVKEVVFVQCLPNDFPDDIRTHAVGRQPYTEGEWERVKKWTLEQSTGRHVVVKEGEFWCFWLMLCLFLTACGIRYAGVITY